MANPPCIIETTPANFRTLLLENSDKGHELAVNRRSLLSEALH